MGFFSAVSDSWNEACYETNNQFRRIGSVLRVDLSSGYRYGVYIGGDKIILVQGRKVKKMDFEDFKEGIGFFSAGWVKSMLFDTKKTAGESCKCALNMVGEQVDMSNEEFAMYCRTGDKDFSDYDTGDEFGLDALQSREDPASEKVALRDRKNARRKLIRKAVREHRKPLVGAMCKDLKVLLPNDLFEVENNGGKDIIITTSTDESLKCLSSALSVMAQDAKQDRIEFTLSTSLEAEDDVINKILTAAEKRYKTGLYKGICYLENKDRFLMEFPKRVQMAYQLPSS